MDLATPDRATLAAAQPTAEQAAALRNLKAVSAFLEESLPSRLSQIRGVVKAIDALAFSISEGARADQIEHVWTGLDGVAALIDMLDNEYDAAEVQLTHAWREVEALRASTGTVMPATLATIAKVIGGDADVEEIEAIRAAAHELHRLSEAEEGYRATLHALHDAIAAQGWGLRWTVQPDNTPYLVLNPPRAARK